jgi:Flp pilus assembly protein TadD
VKPPSAISRISLDSRVALQAALALLVLAVYGRTVSFPFVSFDDAAFLTRNPAVRDGLTWSSVRWAFSTDMDAGWIPLTWLSRLLDVSLFGMDAGWHHGVNVALHAANVLLCFRFLEEATGRRWESAFAAALFAVHPLHVESVAWVTERKDVLAGLFWFLSLTAYVRWTRSPSRGGYAFLLLFFALSLMSKPIAVTLPFVLLLLDFWPLGRLALGGIGPSPPGEGASPPSGGDSPGDAARPWRRLLAEKAPLFALSAAASVATYALQSRIAALTPGTAMPAWALVGNSVLSYGLYLWKTVWPARLAVFYPHPGPDLPPAATFLSFLLLSALSVLAWRERRRRPWLLAGWLWFLGVLVPVIGLVQAGGKGMADRCVYLPSTGLYAAVAWGASEAVRRLRTGPRATAAAAALLLAALSSRAFVQAGYWRGTEPLFRHALEVTERNWMAHLSLGLAAFEGGRNGEARAHYREALRYQTELPEVNNALGRLSQDEGRIGEAVAFYREELRIQPRSGEAWYNLGTALDLLGRREEAERAYGEALRADPANAEAQNNLAVHLEERGMTEEALRRYREAVRLSPSFAEARRNLGLALAREGMTAEGTAELREAVRLAPSRPEGHNDLGVLLARQGRFAEAAVRFREALRLRPGYEEARRNLERVLSEGGGSGSGGAGAPPPSAATP